MVRWLLTLMAWSAMLVFSASGILGAASSRQQPSGALQASPSPRATLDKYCIGCHNQKARVGGLMLDTADVTNVSADPATWEKVARKLRAGSMPPVGLPRPDKSTYEAVASRLESEIDRAAAANPNPGRVPPLHRLNRTEYRNAIRALLALGDIDVTTLLPPDDTSYGFDNIAEALWMSSPLLERYKSAARKLSQLAVGSLGVPVTGRRYQMALDFTQDYQREDLPFGTRGGIRIDHHFPVDGEYSINVALPKTPGDNPDPGANLFGPQQIEVSIDGERAEVITVHPPAQGTEKDVGDDLGGINLRAALGILQVRIHVKAGRRSVGVTFLKKPSVELEEPRQPFVRRSVAELRGELYLDNVEIVGPLVVSGPGDTPSRRLVFVCHPATRADEAPCAKRILATLARRAYRRPVTDEDLAVLLPFYEEGRSRSGFDAGIELALQRLLVSPSFLFRVESDPVGIAPNTNYRISDLELASRLSFFLWSSVPDDELLDVAIAKKLQNPTILAQQVRRMLADRRSEAIASNFAGQWLSLRGLPGVRPEQKAFPDFDDNLRQDFRRETELFFDSILREDRSVIELLTAKYTFATERLARHYGIPNVYGSHFRRIALADDSPRVGLLGQGSILTATSYGNRTSPVLRGKWILENILGAPPPPPPPDVPDLKDANPQGQVLSMRERMAQHRANPVCASCHSRMDPLGLALENFDAVGQWRTRSESRTPIDATGAMPDGTKFDGPTQLRQALVSHSGEFVTVVTEKLLTYALGRGTEHTDAPAVRQIIRDAAPKNYTLSALITGVVNSQPFQMRRSLPRLSGTIVARP